MNNNLEKQILYALAFNEEFSRKVAPYIKEEYFSSEDKILYKAINAFIVEYNRLPTLDSLIIDVSNSKNISENEEKECLDILKSWEKTPPKVDKQWLLDATETFCQDKAIYHGMKKSLEIMNKKDGHLSKGAIPGILQEALSVSFDPNIGHNYLASYDERYEFYHKVEEKIPFDLEYFNKITKGGVARKTISILMAGTGVGKSLAMCHMAAANLTMGYNVLYITLEMSEERIAERIDANLLNVSMDELVKLPEDLYKEKIKKIGKKTTGNLIIKEYPTSSASAQHFRNLLNELKLKRNFIPDIIYVDYLNIAASYRLGGKSNSYEYVKSIAEEIRGLAVEFNVAIITATQTNRQGHENSDTSLSEISDSFGTAMTGDLVLAMISTEELSQLGQMMVKQLKNRYSDINYLKRFMIGVDKSKMKLYDAENSAQSGIVDAGIGHDHVNDTKSKFKGLKV